MKVFKTAVAIMGILIGTLLIIGLLFAYETRWKLTDVGTEISPDGRYSIRFQEVGEPDFPFGNSHAKVTVYDGKAAIKTFREDISDDGGSFIEDNYSVKWIPDGVVITFRGSEQEDHEISVMYDD